MDKKVYEELSKEISDIKIIDSHQHLVPEEIALKENRDFFSLFYGYPYLDLVNAGMSEDQVQTIFNKDIAIETRWEIFSPFWQEVKYTSYSQCILRAIKKIYGFNDISSSNYKDISKAVEENTKKGLYKRILRDHCNIELALTQCYKTDVDEDKDDKLLLPVMPIYTGCGTTNASWESWEDFRIHGPFEGYYGYEKPWKYTGSPIRTLDDCIDNQLYYLKKMKQEGAAGIKFFTEPILDTKKPPDRKKALEIFNDFKSGRIKRLEHPNELYYYLLDTALKNSIEQDFVIAVHTGYWGDFRDLSPLNLIPFLMRYPEGKFDIYHLGYPWIRESIMLAKGFSNVYIDLCWVYAISQKAATEALDEIIETIPTNKVIGFGGDFFYEGVENTYGVLEMAKESLVKVLASRISNGYMDIDSGIEIMKKYFYGNVKNYMIYSNHLKLIV